MKSFAWQPQRGWWVLIKRRCPTVEARQRDDETVKIYELWQELREALQCANIWTKLDEWRSTEIAVDSSTSAACSRISVEVPCDTSGIVVAYASECAAAGEQQI